MEFIVALLVLFVAARLAGEAFEQVRQSPMIGEVLAGIVLGPALLGLIDPDPATEPGASLSVVASLGVLVLVLLAGIELGREGLKQAMKERSIVVAAVEFVLPFALGYGLATYLGMPFPIPLFLGTALAVTALPVSVRILMDLGLLHSRLGRAIVSVALVNDLVAFAMLGLIVDFAFAGPAALDPWAGMLIVAKNLVFLGLVVSLHLVLKRITLISSVGTSFMQRLLDRARGQETAFAIGIAIALGLGGVAELAGIHFAVGVFYGGLLLSPRLFGEYQFLRIRTAVHAVSFGLFTPIFFAVVGLNFRINLDAWPLILVVTGIAFAGKLAGGIIGGYAAGFRGAPLVALGVGLNARGMMELLLAQVGLATGLIGPDLYSALVVMTLVTTLVTPPLTKRLMRRFRAKDVLPAIATALPKESA